MILPNQLTVLRIILTPIFVFFFLAPSELSKDISLVIFIIAALTDWYDGWLARKFNYFTSWGKFWDPLADKILTAGAFLGFVYLGVLPAWMIFIMLFRDFFITFFRSFADRKGFSFPTSLYAKWKTFIQMVFLYYLLIFWVLSRNTYLAVNYKHTFDILLHPAFIWYGTLAITIITVHSGILYLWDNFTVLKKLLHL